MSGNLTELKFSSMVPVQVSNSMSNEIRLYGNINKMISRQAIWEADMSQSHKSYNRMSGFQGARLPLGTTEGNPRNFPYWGLMTPPNNSSRPALSSLTADEIPQIIQLNAQQAEKERMYVNKLAFSMRMNNPYLPQHFD